MRYTVSNIIKGASNYIKDHIDLIDRKDIDIEKRALEGVRAGICSQCEFIKDSSVIRYLKDTNYPKLSNKVCSKCSCLLSLKIRSDSKCPIESW
jgi:hypothetical protein